jgi:D-alanyl-D-alanine carboxypeptidase
MVRPTPVGAPRSVVHSASHRSARRVLAAIIAATVVAVGIAACVATGPAGDLPLGIPTFPSSPYNDALTAENGYVAVGESVSPFDEHLPTINKLDPALLDAVQAAAVDAEADSITMVVTSGWRSAAYQQALLDEATVTYGSLEEARKWVNTPELSTHISGSAVDIGYTDASYWLIQYGSDYGLCQTYSNETWHFELATEPGGECPAMKENAAG